MIWYYVICVGGTVVLAAIGLTASSSGDGLFRLQQRAGVALTPTVRPRVVTRLRGDSIAAAAGAFLVGTAAALLLPHDRLSNEALADPFFIGLLISFAIGGALGSFLFLAISDGRGWTGTYRGSESRNPRVRDYFGHFATRWTAGTLAFLAVILALEAVFAATGTLRPPRPVPLTPAAASLEAGVALFCLIAVGGRAVVRRDHFVGSNEERAWNDALRADSLRNLLFLSAALPGAVIYFTSLGQMAQWHTPTSGGIPTFLATLSIVGWIGSIVSRSALLSRGSHEWLAALWPELAAQIPALPPRRGARWLWSRPSDPDFPLAGPITVKPPVDSQ